MRLTYAIVFVSDMERSTAFYRDAIGLPLKFETPEWTEFATEGATLALHASDEVAGHHTTGDHPPGHCRPGISVSDLDEFHARMVDKGVPCLQEPEATFGARLAQYRDPDGLAVSVSEEKSDA